MFPADFTSSPFPPILIPHPFLLHFTDSFKHSFGWHLLLFWLSQEHQISFWNSSVQIVGNLDAAVIPGEHIPLSEQTETDACPAWLSRPGMWPKLSYQMLFLRQLSQGQRDNRKVCNIHTAGVACSPHSFALQRLPGFLIPSPSAVPMIPAHFQCDLPSSHYSVSFLVVFQ